MDPHPDVTFERLYEHRAWVRRLALGLAHDVATADDVEQVTWITALRRPPREASNLRSWLGGLVRASARSLARVEARRARREHATAEREAQPTPDEALERAELSRALVEAVLALREPFRTAIVLAYFEGLSPAEVAQRTGVPDATARTRIHRGLALLRVALDARNAGHRARWLGALVPLTGGIERSLPSIAARTVLFGGLAMSMKTKIASVAALFALLVALAWQRSPALAPEVARDLGPPAREVAIDSAPVNAPTLASVDAHGRSQEPNAQPHAAGLATTLDVRAVWKKDGSPAVDIAIALERFDGAARSEARVLRTDALGQVRFEDVAAGPANVWVERGGYERIEIVPNDANSIVVEIPDGPTLRGRVVMPSGEPVAGADVRLSWSSRSPSDATTVTHTDADGRFALGSVATGHFVSARAPGLSPSGGRLIKERAGDVVDVTLTLLGAGGSVEGVVVDLAGAPIAQAVVEIGALKPTSSMLPDGSSGTTPPALVVRTDASGAFRADGVAPGDTSVEARTLTFAPTRSRIVVRAGETSSVTLALGRGGSLRGVVSSADGVPAAKVAIEVTSEHAGEWPLRLASTSTRSDGSFEIDRLPSGTLAVIADGSQRGRLLAQIEMREGEAATWNAVLDCGRSLSGTVVDENGAPVVRAFVVVKPNLRRFNDVELRAMMSWPPHWGQSWTDAAGGFRICNLLDLPLALEVRPPSRPFDHAIARLEDVEAGASGLVVRVPASAPANGWVTGRIVDDAGIPVARAELNLHPEPIQLTSTGSYGESGVDGRFRLGPLPPGTYGLNVRAAGHVVLESEAVEIALDATHDFGDLETVRGATIVTKITPASGALANDLQVSAHQHNAKRSEPLTLFGDRARSPALKPGPWLVVVRDARNKTVGEELVLADEAREYEIEIRVP